MEIQENINLLELKLSYLIFKEFKIGRISIVSEPKINHNTTIEFLFLLAIVSTRSGSEMDQIYAKNELMLSIVRISGRPKRRFSEPNRNFN